jgi:Suppressor of fused protein (SUFU)
VESQPSPNSNPESDENPEADAAIRELVSMVNTMLAEPERFQTRARNWITTPGFNDLYDDAHPRLVLKLIATLLGSGKTFKMRSSKLREDYYQLCNDGELLFASGVITNPAMSNQPNQRFPASVVATRKQDIATLMRLGLLGQELGELYVGGSSDSMPKCRQLIADDTYRPLRQRPLPPAETGGLEASLFDVRFSAAEIFLDEDAFPFVPLLVHPTNGTFIVVPWAILHGRPVSPAKPSGPPPLPKTPPPLPGGTKVSPGGSRMIKYEAPSNDWVPADMSGKASEIIEPHIEKYIGTAATVFHELVSHHVHLDVHFVPPGPARLYHTLVTAGMSDLPMNPPQGAEEFRFAELMLCLPADWDLNQIQLPAAGGEAFPSEESYWPVRSLKQFARFPHEFKTWLWLNHTIPNGNPPAPIVEGSLSPASC